MEKTREDRDRALAIAHDVKERLRLGTLWAQRYGYLNQLAALPVLRQKPHRQTHHYLRVIEQTFGVCAVGALVLSAIRLFGSCRNSDFGCPHSFEWAQVRIGSAFTECELYCVEAAFERTPILHLVNAVRAGCIDATELRRSLVFGNRSRRKPYPEGLCRERPSPKNVRLRAVIWRVCDNVIKNDGVFAPSVK